MSNSEYFLNKLSKLFEIGLTSTKEFKREFDNFIQFKLEGVIGKLNLVSRDEFEIQKKIIKNLQDNNVRYDMTIQRLIYNVSKNSGDVANNLDLVDSLHNVTKLEHTMRVETFRKIVEDLKHIKKDIKLLQTKKLFHQHQDTTRSSGWITNILTKATE